MTIGQMMEGFNNIELLEKDLMRDLTDKEKKVILTEGWEKFLFGPENLNFSEEDYKELKALRKIISAFYTQDETEFLKAIKNSPESIYYVLMEIIKTIEDNQACSNTDADCKNVCTKEIKHDPVQEFVQFLQDVYDKVPKGDRSWFNKLTDSDRKRLFEEVYLKERNEMQDCDDNTLSGILTDAVKDFVIEDMVAKLKNKEVVEMTNDEYLEVADYLCKHENHIFLSNENGKVRLVVF